jgi:SAM-dependent methyltransferase
MDENCDSRLYWDETADEYQAITRISLDDFHFGPLLPGDKKLKILPPIFSGMRSLEIGAGAGQNSIYLASLGADCVVTDISSEQLSHGKILAVKAGLSLKFERAGLDEINLESFGEFDLIHTTWALPFAEDQQKVVENCAKMLKKNGTLVFTTGHPNFAGEWIALDEFEEGMFVSDYFDPPREVRFTKDEDHFIRARQYPLSSYVKWILDCGLSLTGLYEHQPINLPLLSEDEIMLETPYDSEVWRELYPQISKVPFVVTYVAKKM